MAIQQYIRQKAIPLQNTYCNTTGRTQTVTEAGVTAYLRLGDMGPGAVDRCIRGGRKQKEALLVAGAIIKYNKPQTM